jgi:hypothetical protein
VYVAALRGAKQEDTFLFVSGLKVLRISMTSDGNKVQANRMTSDSLPELARLRCTCESPSQHRFVIWFLVFSIILLIIGNLS